MKSIHFRIRVPTEPHNLLQMESKAIETDMSNYIRRVILKELALLSYLADEQKKALGVIAGCIQWTVMYPDSFPKNSVQIQNKMIEYGFAEVWNQLSTAIENFLSTNYQAFCNALRNALTRFIRELAKKYNVDEKQFGTQRMNLVKIDFIDNNFSDSIGKYYGHLSKFSKALDAPSVLECQYLLDMALSVFGFLVRRMDEFKIEEKATGESKS